MLFQASFIELWIKVNEPTDTRLEMHKGAFIGCCLMIT
jgi:hypothetical protein